MTRLVSLSVFLSGLISYLSIQAQNIPLGTWRTHPSHAALRTVAVAGSQVYGGGNGGVLYFDQTYGNTKTLSRLDGLSSTRVSRLAYAVPQQMLIIAYADGNIDLWQENKITAISALATANLPESRFIRHITLAGDRAYLSGDFGVVVLDLVQKNIRESYRNIGPDGASVAVRGSAVAAGQLYLATAAGILQAPLNGSNLQDFRNWSAIAPPENVPAEATASVAAVGNKLYAAFKGHSVFIRENNTWRNLALPLSEAVNSLETVGNELAASVPGKVWLLDQNEKWREITHPALVNPREVEVDAAGKLWIADAGNGLVSNWEGDFKSYLPNGPLSNVNRRLVYGNGAILALPGGFTSQYSPLGDSTSFSHFTTQGWQQYAPTVPSAQPIPAITDLVSAAFNPVDQTWYIGSYGDGLLIKSADGTFSLFNQTNSPLVESAERGIRVTGLAVDKEGNTWVATHGAPFGQPSLYARHKDGTWQSFAFNNTAARYPLGIAIDDNGYKWLPLSPSLGGGLWVFDDKNSQGRYLSTAIGSGGLPNGNVRSIAKDRDGQIWVGTDRGVAVFLTPADIFRTGGVDAVPPVYERRLLLRDEVVTAVAVDGGNRKWFGTRNGIFLFSPTADQLVAHFTTRNSPLPSDSIADVAIHPVTGEVFMATAVGLVSFRGTATEAEATPSAIKIFPNPIRPGFEGLVGISGLFEDAVVKITDVSGRLVHETRAHGGTAVWNVRDYTGRKAATGVYLVYASDTQGNELLVGKMAVME